MASYSRSSSSSRSSAVAPRIQYLDPASLLENGTSYTQIDLRDILVEYHLSTSGSKDQMFNRVLAYALSDENLQLQTITGQKRGAPPTFMERRRDEVEDDEDEACDEADENPRVQPQAQSRGSAPLRPIIA